MSRGEDGDGDSISGRRVGPKYPDSHQLFVGNLPHNITERELKAFFEGEVSNNFSFKMSLPKLICIHDNNHLSVK